MTKLSKRLLAPLKRLLGRPKWSSAGSIISSVASDQPEERPDPEIANGVVIYHSLRTVHLLFHVPSHGAFSQAFYVPPDETIRPAQDYSDFANKTASQSNPPLSLLDPLDAIDQGYKPLQPLEP